MKKEAKSKRARVRNSVIRIIDLFLGFCFFSCVCILFYLNLRVSTLEVIQLPRGSIKTIVAHLHSQKVDVNTLDSLILRFFGKPQSGWIDLGGSEMAKADLLYKLTKAKPPLKEITLIPGESAVFFIEQISQTLKIPKEELWRAYKERVECEDGNIIPQTYKIPYGINANELFAYLLNYSQKEYEKIAKQYGYEVNSKEWKQILSIASIIQKEAANTQEMPLVSAVVYNRLKKGMPLQMDGSLNYGEYSHQKITPQRIREDNTPFNTYRYKGVPPCPCGSISKTALLSSLNPASVPYLYFVRNKNGVHSFSTNYKEHQENFKR